MVQSPASAPPPAKKRRWPVVAGLAVAALLVLIGIGVWGFALGGFSSAAVLSSATTYVVNSSGEEALYCTKTYNKNGVLIQAEYDEAAFGTGEYYSYTRILTYSDGGDLQTVERREVDAETLEETYELQTYEYKYDEDDNPVSITLSVAEAEGATASEVASAELEYDASGRVEAFTVTCLGDSDSAGDFFYSGEISYTEDGRVSSIAWRIRDLASGDDLVYTVDDEPATVYSDYNPPDDAQAGSTVTYEYDTDGNLETVSGIGPILCTFIVANSGYDTTYSTDLLFAPSVLRDGLFGLNACEDSDAFTYLLAWAISYSLSYDSYGTICGIYNDLDAKYPVVCSYQCEYDEAGNALKAVHQEYGYEGEAQDWYEVTYFTYR